MLSRTTSCVSAHRRQRTTPPRGRKGRHPQRPHPLVLLRRLPRPLSSRTSRSSRKSRTSRLFICRHARQGLLHRTLHRPRIRRRLLERRLQRQSPRHQEAVLCHRLCHLRPLRICPRYGRPRGPGLCPAALRVHRGPRLRPRAQRLHRSSLTRLATLGRHAPLRPRRQLPEVAKHPSAHHRALRQPLPHAERVSGQFIVRLRPRHRLRASYRYRRGARGHASRRRRSAQHHRHLYRPHPQSRNPPPRPLLRHGLDAWCRPARELWPRHRVLVAHARGCPRPTVR